MSADCRIDDQNQKFVFMHFSALIQHTEKAVNRAQNERYEICQTVLTWMIMQDRLFLNEEIHLDTEHMFDD